MRKLKNIALENHDLPFYKLEDEAVEPPLTAGDIIEKEYKDMILNMWN